VVLGFESRLPSRRPAGGPAAWARPESARPALDLKQNKPKPPSTHLLDHSPATGNTSTLIKDSLFPSL